MKVTGTSWVLEETKYRMIFTKIFTFLRNSPAHIHLICCLTDIFPRHKADPSSQKALVVQ